MNSLIAIHVLISLVAIGTGLAVMGSLVRGRWPHLWTPTFLWTTVATSVTGFLFPFKGVTPAFIFGVVSLLVLAVSLYALYGRQLAGRWGRTYIVTAMFALYLNVFVLVAQSFMKIPALHALAPTQTEPAFGIVQGVILVTFAALVFKQLLAFDPAVVGAARVDNTGRHVQGVAVRHG